MKKVKSDRNHFGKIKSFTKRMPIFSALIVCFILTIFSSCGNSEKQEGIEGIWVNAYSFKNFDEDNKEWQPSNKDIEDWNGTRIEIKNNKVLEFYGINLPSIETEIQLNKQDSTAVISNRKWHYPDGSEEHDSNLCRKVECYLRFPNLLIYDGAVYWRITSDEVDDYIVRGTEKLKQEEEELQVRRKSYSNDNYLYGVWVYENNGIQAKYIIESNNTYSFFSSIAGAESGTWTGNPKQIFLETNTGFKVGSGFITEDGKLNILGMLFSKN